MAGIDSELYSTEKPPERALLIGLECVGQSRWDVQDSLRELQQLVESAGVAVAKTAIQRLPKPTAPYYIGMGKANELAEYAKTEEVSTIVFDDELTPAQSRNLEKLFLRKVLDRTQLILDIFAQRAKTREGKLQIELAQLQYLLPRLTRLWTHLSRQSGGVGTRGPGETQLEVDRRRVQEKIIRLERELEVVRKSRMIQRQGRQRHEWPVVALVGYTNAGKSTLLNRLTDAGVYAADKLFATLDPTTRKTSLPGKQTILLSDTVGFLKKLPHNLVESFKATLEEVSEADLLLHVIDVSHPQFEQQMEAVHDVLGQINAADKPMVYVFNKMDRVTGSDLVERVLTQNPHSVSVSAMTGDGIAQLLNEIETRIEPKRDEVRLKMPSSESAKISALYREGTVRSIKYKGNFAHISVHLPPRSVERYRDYLVKK